MHIVLLNDYSPLSGENSVAQITKNLAKELQKIGHRVSIITTHRTDYSSEMIINKKDGIFSIPVSYRPSLRHYLSVYNPKVSKQISQIFKQLKPDVVHAHNIHQYLTYNSLRIAKKYTNKVFLTCHDAMSIAYGRLATKRYLASEGKDTCLNFLDHISKAGLQYNPMRNILIKRILNKNKVQVVAVSNALKNALETNGIQNVYVIHNGIKIEEWQASKEEISQCRAKYSLNGKKIILFVGRIRRDKGIFQLLNALSFIQNKIPNVLLLAVGEEDRWNNLLKEENIEQKIIQNQLCIGWMPHNKLAAVYGASDVVVTPSICLDTFNLINLEAMSCEKPLVGTCFGGTQEIIINNKTGFIRNPLNTEKFSNAVMQLLENIELAKKMGKAGALHAKEKFIFKGMVEKYLQLYSNKV